MHPSICLSHPSLAPFDAPQEYASDEPSLTLCRVRVAALASSVDTARDGASIFLSSSRGALTCDFDKIEFKESLVLCGIGACAHASGTSRSALAPSDSSIMASGSTASSGAKFNFSDFPGENPVGHKSKLYFENLNDAVAHLGITSSRGDYGDFSLKRCGKTIDTMRFLGVQGCSKHSRSLKSDQV